MLSNCNFLYRTTVKALEKSKIALMVLAEGFNGFEVELETSFV